MFVARFLPEAQEEFFASAGDDAVLATGSAGGGAIHRDGSGWELTGRWAFVSGINVASGVMVTAREAPEGGISHFALLLPGEYQVHDTWHVEGLRGTGSHDVSADQAYLPARRVVTIEEFASMNPPGAAVAESYVHRVRTFPYQGSWFQGPLLGAARGALESYCAQTRARKGKLFRESIVSQAPVQVRVGEALRAARRSGIGVRGSDPGPSRRRRGRRGDRRPAAAAHAAAGDIRGAAHARPRRTHWRP